MIAPFIVAGLLYSRARERGEAQEPVLRPAHPVATSVWTGQEIAVVLLFALGGVLAFSTGPIGGIVAAAAAAVGLFLVWMSRRWKKREKQVATLIVGASPFAALAMGGLVPLADDSGFGSAALSLILLMPLGLAFGMIAAAVYVTVVLNRRRP